MKASLKTSDFRSEMRTIKTQNANYLVIKFKDDKNDNSEYHVYAEVIASDAAEKCSKEFKVSLGQNDNTRTKWDKIWACLSK